MFLWLLFRDSLLTNEVNARRGMYSVPCCDLCGAVLNPPYMRYVIVQILDWYGNE